MRKYLPFFVTLLALSLAAFGFSQDRTKGLKVFVHKGAAYSKRESKGFNHAMKRDNRKLNRQMTPRHELRENDEKVAEENEANYRAHHHHRHHRRHRRHHHHHRMVHHKK